VSAPTLAGLGCGDVPRPGWCSGCALTAFGLSGFEATWARMAPPQQAVFCMLSQVQDAFLHFTRFLECLCLYEGDWLPSSESVGDAVHWHQTMLHGQYR
jgi:hypothetical protein